MLSSKKTAPGLSAAQTSRTMAIASSASTPSPGVRRGPPIASIWSHTRPAPIPSSKRAPESRSTEAAARASMTGGCRSGRVQHVVADPNPRGARRRRRDPAARSPAGREWCRSHQVEAGLVRDHRQLDGVSRCAAGEMNVRRAARVRSPCNRGQDSCRRCQATASHGPPLPSRARFAIKTSGLLTESADPCPRIGPSPEASVTSNAVASSSEQTLLGEGARWDARRDELLGVDILAGRVFRAQAGGDGGLRLVRDYRLPGTVGAIAPVEVTTVGYWPPAAASSTCLRTVRCARSRARPAGDADERRRLRSAGSVLGQHVGR